MKENLVEVNPYQSPTVETTVTIEEDRLPGQCRRSRAAMAGVGLLYGILTGGTAGAVSSALLGVAMFVVESLRHLGPDGAVEVLFGLVTFGAVLGGLCGAFSGAIVGPIVGAAIGNQHEDCRASVTLTACTLSGIAGAIFGGLGGSIFGPVGLLVGLVIGAAGAAIGGLVLGRGLGNVAWGPKSKRGDN